MPILGRINFDTPRWARINALVTAGVGLVANPTEGAAAAGRVLVGVAAWIGAEILHRPGAIAIRAGVAISLAVELARKGAGQLITGPAVTINPHSIRRAQGNVCAGVSITTGAEFLREASGFLLTGPIITANPHPTRSAAGRVVPGVALFLNNHFSADAAGIVAPGVAITGQPRTFKDPGAGALRASTGPNISFTGSVLLTGWVTSSGVPFATSGGTALVAAL